MNASYTGRVDILTTINSQVSHGSITTGLWNRAPIWGAALRWTPVLDLIKSLGIAASRTLCLLWKYIQRKTYLHHLIQPSLSTRTISTTFTVNSFAPTLFTTYLFHSCLNQLRTPLTIHKSLITSPSYLYHAYYIPYIITSLLPFKIIY
jgi:hypothetical protein